MKKPLLHAEANIIWYNHTEGNLVISGEDEDPLWLSNSTPRNSPISMCRDSPLLESVFPSLGEWESFTEMHVKELNLTYINMDTFEKQNDE